MHIFLDANICLDLLDTTRPTSKASVDWYIKNKDDLSLQFYFSGDFITTFYYILTERRGLNKDKVVAAIDALGSEISPFYLNHSDFKLAQETFRSKLHDNFEDLMIMQSALRCGCGYFITNDKALLELQQYGPLIINTP